MNIQHQIKFFTIGAAFGAAIVLAGCTPSAKKSQATVEPIVETVSSQPAPQQPQFDTPAAAVQALVAAAQAQDRAAVRNLLGVAGDELSSGDAVADANDFKTFAAHAAEAMRVEEISPTSAQIYIGQKDWPFPIPLARADAGKWYFDTDAGKARILARRIGHNELETIAVCQAYLQAQRVYGSADRDGDGVLQYAQRLNSRPGHHDGLYWPAGADEPQSPFGPLAAQAAAEGYGPVKGAARSPFHGYLFRVLTRQGPGAPGGKYDYVINGRMIAGFALVAWPEKYASSGIMSFIVNHYGQIYQKDLGPDTSAIAGDMSSYDPDPTWTAVK